MKDEIYNQSPRQRINEKPIEKERLLVNKLKTCTSE